MNGAVKARTIPAWGRSMSVQPYLPSRRQALNHRSGERFLNNHGLRLKMVVSLLLITLLLVTIPNSTAAPASGWQGATAFSVTTDVDMPTDIDVAADGSIWFTELAGNVSRHDPSTGETELVHHVEDVVTGVERGLVGLALADDHANTGAFYLYYSERTDDPDGGINRLVRVVDGEERQIVSLSAAVEHNGGRIVVAPDGTLFVGTGENSEHDPAQDPASLLGKVLHMTPEGEPVEGNLEGLVYSLGHRNVYGLAMDPETGALWATENMGWRRDEINIIEPGGNYGYPECEGHHLHGVDEPCPTDKGYTFPILTFYEDRAVAPTGAVFWQGDFYWASFNEGSIHRVTAGPGEDTWNDTLVFQHEGPVLDLHIGQEDQMYFAAMDGIWRIGPQGDEGPADDSQDGAGPAGAVNEGVPATPLAASIVMLVAAAWASRRRCA